MTPLPDAVLRHLQEIAVEPDLSGTKYSLVRELDRGAMGIVYLVHDSELDRDVAMKVVAGDLPPAAAGRMKEEARILARLEHPGIVPIHDAGTLADGRLFTVMKLVRGERLDRLAAGRPLEELLRIFLRVGDAVAFAHEQGVVHRDIKPQNVMVGSFGQVLLLDWGVARSDRTGDPATGKSSRPGTEHGSVIGTPGFMSPEQAAGKPATDRSDVFSLGRLLEFLVDVSAGGARPPLRSVMARATHPEPSARYPSVTSLTADVERYLAREPVSAHHENPLERAARWAMRYRVPLALVAAYIVMRAALILWLRAPR